MLKKNIEYVWQHLHIWVLTFVLFFYFINFNTQTQEDYLYTLLVCFFYVLGLDFVFSIFIIVFGGVLGVPGVSICYFVGLWVLIVKMQLTPVGFLATMLLLTFASISLHIDLQRMYDDNFRGVGIKEVFSVLMQSF